MLVNYDKESQAIAYGITGGIPEYLSKIDTNKSLDENILDLFLMKMELFLKKQLIF